MHRPIVMTQLERADRDFFHCTPDLVDNDILTNAKRIVDQVEKPGDDIAHQGLRAETDGEADHPGAGDQRTDVDPERRQRNQYGHDDDRDLDEGADQRQDGLGAGAAETAGQVTMAQVREIAETKMVDLNAYDIDAAAQIIKGSARSMGLEVVE